MTNSGRSRRGLIANSMSARVMMGAAEPVAVTTMSQDVSSRLIWSHGTASPPTRAASAEAWDAVRFATPDAVHLL